MSCPSLNGPPVTRTSWRGNGRALGGAAARIFDGTGLASTESPWASHPATIPVSTSPEPPVAIPGLPVGLMYTTPSGVATSVRYPFRITYT